MVALFDGEQFVASVRADRYRADLVGRGIGDGRHGFRIPVPDSLRDAGTHTVGVKILGAAPGNSDPNVPLTYSPKILGPCGAPNYGGDILSAGCDVIIGKAWDAGRPNTPVDVDIFVREGGVDVFQARVAADVYDAGIGVGDNRHLFRLPTPAVARDGLPHVITARPAGKDAGYNFPSQPTVTCDAPVYEGQFNSAGCDYLTGWAWDAKRPDAPVSVEVVENGRVVAAALADVLRPDIPTTDGRRHGFRIPLPGSLRDGFAHSLGLRVGGSETLLGGLTSVACPAQAGSCGPEQDLPTTEFVKDFYAGVLARQPRPVELQYWNDALRTGLGQGQPQALAEAKRLGRELFLQAEYAGRGRMTGGAESLYVSDLYWGYLQRGPDAAGHAHWTSAIQTQGQAGWLNALAAFESSPEFSARVATLCPTPGDSVRDYDALADFSPLQNPDGAWTYGYRAPGGAFTTHPSRANMWGAGTDSWSRTGSNGLFVTRNNTGSTYTYPNAPSVVHPAGVLNLHPGPNGEKSVVRWTAAAAGTYVVAGYFKGLDTVGTTADVAVMHNGASLFGANVNGHGQTASFSVSRVVAAGETVEFSVGVGANGNYNYDSTGLSATVSLSPPARTLPYNGVAAQSPGRIEAELFDAGGEGVAYHDATAGAQGQDFDQPPPFPVPAFRQPTDVDINKAAVYSNGYVARMQAGDWMNYTVDVTRPGSYTLSARTYYWGATGGTFHVEADGADVTGPLQPPGGSAWVTVSKAGVQLNAGRHVLRLVCDSNGSDGQSLGEVDYLLLAADADAGLVGHWKFDEGAGLSAADSSGGGGGGTLQGGAAWGVARVGTASVSFDGADDYVQVGARPGLALTTAATFGAWLYPTGAGSGGALGGIVVNKEGEYEIARFPDGTIQWAFANQSPGWNWVNTGHVAPPNRWTHVAVTYEGGAVKTYADGRLVHTYAGSGGIGDALPAQNDFRVGGRQLMSQHFQGRLDDVRVYNRALSAAEVESLVASAPADPTGNDFSEAKKDPANETGAGGDAPLARNFNFSIPLVGLEGRAGLDLGLSLTYNSLVWTRDAATGALKFDADYGDPSPGFRLGLPVIHRKHRNARGENAYMLVTPSGARVELRQAGASNTYEATDSSYTQLTEGAGLTLRPTDGSQLSFALKGYEYKLTQSKDRNGNFISLTYDAAGNVSSITDTLGRVVAFAYDANGRPAAIEQSRNGQTHRWATFGYASVTMGAQFADPSKVTGPANGTALSVLNRVSLQDGSLYAFLYNAWGQIYRVERRAADGTAAGRLLSYVEYDLQTPTAAQTGNWTDCPRFTQRKDFVRDWNNDAPAVTTYGVEGGAQVIVTRNGALPNDVAPDYVKQKVYYEPAGTWRHGLVGKVETFSTLRDGQNTDANVYDLRKTVLTAWTQDDESLAYRLNPRVKRSEVSDPQGNRTGTSHEYTSYGLAVEAKEWSGTESNVLRRTHTEYNLDPAYVSRRVIGLVSSTSVYDKGGFVAAKVDYTYDQGGEFLQHQGTPAQHDAAAYGPAFVAGRGLLTSTRRWDVTALHDAAKSVESRVGYNTTGSPIFSRDPSGHQTRTSYADRFTDRAGTNTLAYPTTVTDPAGFSSKVEYRFDTGLVSRAEDPKGAQQTFTYDAAGRTLRADVKGWDPASNQATSGGYVRWVYSDAMDAVQSWTQVDAGKPESCSISVLDGAGRVRAAASDFPNSVGGYRARYTTYDVAGRVAAQSNQTEVNGLWNPVGTDAGWYWTKQTYDWKGRPLAVTNPGSPASARDKEFIYGGCGCAGGQVVATRDEAGRRQRITYDALGRVWKTQMLLPQDKSAAFTAGPNETVYSTAVHTYNALNQVAEITSHANADEPDPEKVQKTTLTYDGHARLKSRKNPAAARAVTYVYNADDTVLKVLMPRERLGDPAQEVTATLTHNSRHLITRVEYAVPAALSDPTAANHVPATSPVEMSYDENGKRSRMTDGMGAVDYTYDGLDRLKKERRTFQDPANLNISGVVKEINYDYTQSGALKSVTDPAGSRIAYIYDGVGHLTDVKDDTNTPYGGVTQYATGIKYRAWGAVQSLTYGNGRVLSQLYTPRLKVSHFEIGGLVSMDYRYTTAPGGNDDDGLVKYIRDLTQVNSPFDRGFRYDLVGRLTQALSGTEARGGTLADGPYRETYTYDAWDNVTGRTTLNWNSDVTGATPQVTESGERNSAWDYDAGGNVLRVDENNRRFKYDAAGRMVEMTDTVSRPNNSTAARTQRRSYDGDGRWIKELKNNVGTYHVRSTALRGAVLTELDSSGQKLKTNVYAGGELLARQENNKVVWQHRTPFGTSEWDTASNGEVLDRTELDPLNADVGTEPPESEGGAEMGPIFPPFDHPSASSNAVMIDGAFLPDILLSILTNFGSGGGVSSSDGGGVGGTFMMVSATEDHTSTEGVETIDNGGSAQLDGQGMPRLSGAHVTITSRIVSYMINVPTGISIRTFVSQRVSENLRDFQEAVAAVRGILQDDNTCSRSYGGAGLDALNAIDDSVNRAGDSAFQPFPDNDTSTGISMRVPPLTVPQSEAPVTGPGSFTSQAPVSVRINTNGPFVRAWPTGGNGLPRIGGYRPGSLESRVTQLLHEIGHLTVTNATGTAIAVNRGNNQTSIYRMSTLTLLLPVDGGNAALSERNTDRVMGACRGQIDALR
jgi:YD repeat-containing protein